MNNNKTKAIIEQFKTENDKCWPTRQHFRCDQYVPGNIKCPGESKTFKKIICGQLENEDLIVFLGFEIYSLKSS